MKFNNGGGFHVLQLKESSQAIKDKSHFSKENFFGYIVLRHRQPVKSPKSPLCESCHRFNLISPSRKSI